MSARPDTLRFRLRSVPTAGRPDADGTADALPEIDNLPGRIDGRCVVLSQPESAQARGYRLLRHRLFARVDPRVVVVTSAVRGEGKTTCAVNLALCMAEESFATVLLLEANPCRPSLARMFEVAALRSGPPPITNRAAGTSQPNVFALPGARLRLATVSGCAVRHGALDRLLLDIAVRELRDAYDYIVVDTASVLESADANVACDCADGVVVAARAATTRRTTLRRALDQLRPANVLGVALLDV